MSKNIKIVIALGAIVLVVIALWLNSGSGGSLNTTLFGQSVNQSTLSAMSKIANNAALANKIGSGAVGGFPTRINGTILKFNGMPGVLYIGADFCPYCAATRWGLIIALMRFGNFTMLHYTASDPNDVYPNTATFSFYNSAYSSSVIGFAHIELTNRTRSPLQSINVSVNVTFNKYSTTGSIPFADFGNKSIQSGSAFTPGVLKGQSWQQIIAQLNNTNSTISQSIIGAADVFTVQICKATGFTPSACNAPYVQRIIAAGG